MNAMLTTALNRFRLGDASSMLNLIAGPILILMIMAMMILPLPTFALDMLFTFNITLSVMILLVAMFTKKPLDFAAFPTVLLFVTLLRLSLNVASTRVILMNGQNGPGAAGQVIEAFGRFLIGGNFAVGLVVFLILIVINFMVITKGAGRIAEVGARFVLDAMPGKQMAIDADLNAGLIDEDTAKARRHEIEQEADFFGSMDGASKFVRGDAIAGIIIMAINLVGGLLIGILQHDMAFAGAAKTYTLLTIGDGLVAQVPALVVSTAAGVTVSRVGSGEHMGEQLIKQLFTNPQVLFLAAAVMGLLGLVPGMPNFVFLLFTALLAGAGFWLLRNERQAAQQQTQEAPSIEATSEVPEASWDDVELVDPLSLEVGHRLISLVDAQQDGQLLRRIKGVRKKFAQTMGFLPAVVHIRDNLEFQPHSYALALNGVEAGHGEAFPGEWLAINPGQAVGEVTGRETTDPAFGLPATWISDDKRAAAEAQGFTVVDASTVVATHINHMMTQYASDLLGRAETQSLLERVKADAPDLVEEVVPKVISLSTLTIVLQSLLDEEVSIRDMRRILDVLAVHGAQTEDVNQLAAAVRVALGPAIVQQWFPAGQALEVIALDAELEQMLGQVLSNGSGIEPGLAESLVQQAGNAVQQQQERGVNPVLVVQHDLRPLLSRFLRRRLQQLVVLSQAEIPDDRELRVTAVIGGNNQQQ